MAHQGRVCLQLACLLIIASGHLSLARPNQFFQDTCVGPKKGDPIIGHSELIGHPNASDAAWNDHTPYFQQYGPISQIMMLRAYFYDGEWHDPGEFKGLQLWYGDNSYDPALPDKYLFGARRPHLQYNCTLTPGEGIIKAEVQYDHVMRFMEFTTNNGQKCTWGFRNVANTSMALAMAPNAGAYLAAIRGNEGKPLPPEKGGYKKRYIIQVSFVWAQSDCDDLSSGTVFDNRDNGGGFIPWFIRLSQGITALAGRPGATTVYSPTYNAANVNPNTVTPTVVLGPDAFNAERNARNNPTYVPKPSGKLGP